VEAEPAEAVETEVWPGEAAAAEAAAVWPEAPGEAAGSWKAAATPAEPARAVHRAVPVPAPGTV
jgi:hypothetical protein